MKSLKNKIMIPVFLLSTIGIIVISFFAHEMAKEIITNYVELAVEDKVEKLVSSIDYELEEWQGQLELLASTGKVKSLDYGGFLKQMSDKKDLFKQYEVVLISDREGNFVASNGTRGNITDRPYFNRALKGESAISAFSISKTTGNPIIVISVPIIDDYGNVVGLLASTVNLYQVTDIINAEKLGDSGYAYIINSQGLTIAHPRKEFLLNDTLGKSESATLRKIIIKMKKGEEGIGYYNFEHEKKIIAFKAVKSVDWTIGMTASFDEVSENVSKLKNYILLIGIIIVISILTSLYFVTNSLVEPINKLKGYMEIAGKGDLTVSSDINSNDEIGVLSNSFNNLIKENKRLLDEVVKYDKLKTEFFSNISHELKTPLNIIFSSIQLINLSIKEEKEDITKINTYINMIKQNSYRLLRLVNNLIDITRIDSGFMRLNLKRADIVQVIENITLSTVEYVKSKSRTIIFDTDIEEKIIIFDPEKMERIILNLISNAVKFTNPGDEIEIYISDKGDKIQIAVRDTGIGIPREKQEIIFEKFRQVDHLYNRNHEGSGIGLSLVKSLVDMHSGDIRVKSQLGEGTEVIIQLPINLACKEDSMVSIEDCINSSNVEKIQIEFSDIYE